MDDYVNPKNVELIRNALSDGGVTGKFRPTVYVVEITNICNLKCIMCPNRFIDQSNLGYMSLSLFQSIIESIAPYAEFVMLYWLGEPLLHPNFAKMLSMAREKLKGRIVISTNLTQVNDEILSSLLENADIILCSLDRWNPEQFEKIRVGASFSQVVSNIERLINLRKPTHRAEIVVKGLDISFDSAEYHEFKEFWSQKGARPLLAWLNDWAGTFPSIRKAASLPIPHSSSRVPCTDLWFKMVVNWRGEIQMCCFDWMYKYPIGVVGQPDWLQSAWHNRAIIELRSAHVARNFDVNPLCKSCTTWAEPSEHDAYVDFDEKSYFILF